MEYKEFYRIITDLLPHIQDELDSMVAERGERQSNTSIHDKVGAWLGEAETPKDEPSSRHLEPWFQNAWIAIPLDHHIEIHQQAVETIRELEPPATASKDDFRDLLTEISQGTLEHWFRMPLPDGKNLGQRAIERLSAL